MKIYLSFFFCSAIYFRYTFSYEASFVDNGKECVVLSPARCTKTCDCKNYITFNPQSWYRAFLASVKGKKCKCNECRKTKKVRCQNGVCDTTNQKCVCDYCWVGEVCDKFKNKHAPEFDNTQLQVSIPKSHPIELPVTRVTAYDRDLEFCNGMQCPCGDVVYKLHKDFGIFTIDNKTGSISITRSPHLSKYDLTVIATNDEDGAKQDNMNVTISVFNDHRAGIPSDHEPRVLLDGEQEGEYDEDEDEEDDDVLPHHRYRRQVMAGESNTLVISAVPKLDKTYYFNKNEEIVFEVKALNNATATNQITNIKLRVTSVWLTLKNNNISVGLDVFASTTLENQEAVFVATSLNFGKSVIGEITGVVKADIGPLANLNLELNASFEQSGQQDIGLSGVKSSPIVYGVFPEVNVTKYAIAAATYEDISINMRMQLPLLNYSLLVELTTNVECFVFMEVKDVVVNHASGVSFDGSTNPISTKSDNSNGLVDRMVIDFGNISVTGGPAKRSISIDYKIGVKDHANVANGSTHYAGAGLQAGENVLWVDQQNFQITKIEPALEVTYNQSLIVNTSRIFIGDRITVSCRIEHTSTSEATAKKVKLSVVSKHVGFVNGRTVDVVPSEMLLAKTILEKGKVITHDFVLEVQNTISPLMSIPVQLVVDYENKDGTAKFPVKLNVTLPLTGTPVFNFTRIGSGDIVFGSRLEFELTISLMKMNSSLQFEIVLPKYENGIGNGTALMHITSVDVTEIGSQIKDGAGKQKTVNSKAKFFSTSDDAKSKDQAVWDLGLARSKYAGDTKDNQIKIKFGALVNEVQNLTSGSVFKVGVGVIGLPRMVWVGQLNTTLLIKQDRQPRMNFTHTLTNSTGNQYIHTINIEHANGSDQYAYNVTFEYFLPPYVKFLNEVKPGPDIQKVTMVGDRTRFTFVKPLTFVDKIEHSIRVKLKKELSPKTGVFDFMVPCALTYNNYEHKKWQYWKSVTRSMHVRSRAPTIKTKAGAHSNYYGRGMLVHNSNSEIYVCMNMHLPTARPACYKSVDSGDTWTAMDSRVGCVIGYHTDGNLYGIGRNQVIVIKYDKDEKDWTLLNEKQKTDLATFFANKKFNDMAGVTTLEPEEIEAEHMDQSKLWGATDEWVYFRPTVNDQWVKKAKWRL